MDTRIGWDITLAALLLAFALSMTISWVYVATYSGLSYMRSFANTLAIAGVVSALVMLAIGDDVARGIGLVGALTVIRFRSTLKDTRDLMFAFVALSVGVACGVLAFAVAMLRTAVFCAAMAYLSFSDFGTRRMWNAVLRLLEVATGKTSKNAKQGAAKNMRPAVLINARDLGGGTQEHASYHLRLRDASEKALILQSIGEIPGISGATLHMQDTTIEPSESIRNLIGRIPKWLLIALALAGFGICHTDSPSVRGQPLAMQRVIHQIAPLQTARLREVTVVLGQKVKAGDAGAPGRQNLQLKRTRVVAELDQVKANWSPSRMSKASF